jgi:hypothetical protein
VPVADGLLYRLAVLLSRLGLQAPIEQLYQVGTDPPHYSYFSRRSLLHLLATLRLQVRAVVGDADFDAATMRGRVRALRRLPGPAVSSGSRAAVLIGRWLSAEDAIIVLARPQSGGH